VAPFPSQVLRAWGLANPLSINVPGSGTMNETWLLKWADRQAVLRRHRRLDRPSIDFEHTVLAHVKDGGIPCPTVIPTRSGEQIVEHQGRFYSLSTWAPGTQVARGQIGPSQALCMGSTLARIHAVLVDVIGGPDANDPPIPLDATLERLDRLNQLAKQRPDQAGLSWVSDYLKDKERWLRSHPPVEPGVPSGTRQIIHGDYQDTNIFFQGSDVTCVIDWDKARREVPAREVVRALDYGLQMDPSLCRSFLRGYRSSRHLGSDELSAAAEWFAYHQAHNLWAIEKIVIERDERVARLTGVLPFRAFEVAWHTAELG
jgi:Ser/Thr protein kinase RdoA (MazF antagonist)